MTVVVPERVEPCKHSALLNPNPPDMRKIENHESSLGSLGWTEQEDRRLIELHRKYGNRWALIKKFMGGKTGQQCLKRWRYTLDPAVRKDLWTQEETEKLMKLHEELGSKWSDIARKLGTGRTDIQCRYRYFRVIGGKATNTMSRDTSRLYRTYSVCDSSGLNEETVNKDLDLTKDIMRRRSSDPERIGGTHLFENENIYYNTRTHVSHSLDSQVSEGTHFAPGFCSLHSPYDKVGQEYSGTFYGTSKESVGGTVCPECGITRMRPLHSLSSSRMWESNNMSYASSNAYSFSGQASWVALDSMMGVPQGVVQHESPENLPNRNLELFGDGRRNEETSFNSLMGIPNTFSRASGTDMVFKMESYSVLPPLDLGKRNAFVDIEDSLTKDICNLPPLRNC